MAKIGAKFIRHPRYVVFQMAEALESKSLSTEILECVSRLTLVASTLGAG